MPLKSKLLNKQYTIGSWLMTNSTVVADVMTYSGLDWLVIDHEHTCTEFFHIENLITQIQKNNAEALVRVAKNDEVFIKKSLDAGANGVIVPMVKTLKEAQAAIEYCFYPPHGKRGVGLYRAQKYGYDFERYVSNHHKEITLILQVEHIDILKDLEAISKLELIDGFIVGPYDFSASMGKPGEFNDSDVANALGEVEKIITKSQKSLGFHIIQPDPLLVFERRKSGYNFFAFSIDYLFIGNAIREKLKILKSQE